MVAFGGRAVLFGLAILYVIVGDALPSLFPVVYGCIWGGLPVFFGARVWWLGRKYVFLCGYLCLGGFVGALPTCREIRRAVFVDQAFTYSGCFLLSDVMFKTYGRGFSEAIVLSDVCVHGICGAIVLCDTARDFGAHFCGATVAFDWPNVLWIVSLSHAGAGLVFSTHGTFGYSYT